MKYSHNWHDDYRHVFDIWSLDGKNNVNGRVSQELQFAIVKMKELYNVTILATPAVSGGTSGPSTLGENGSVNEWGNWSDDVPYRVGDVVVWDPIDDWAPQGGIGEILEIIDDTHVLVRATNGVTIDQDVILDKQCLKHGSARNAPERHQKFVNILQGLLEIAESQPPEARWTVGTHLS